MDFQLPLRPLSLTCLQPAGPAVGELLPLLGVWETIRVAVVEADRRVVHGSQLVQETPFLAGPQRLVVIEAADEFRLLEELHDDRVSRVEFRRPLGYHFRLGKKLLVHFPVEIVDHLGEFFLLLEFQASLAVDFLAGMIVSFLQFDAGLILLDVLPRFPKRAVDAHQQLFASVRFQARFCDLLSGLLQQR